MRLPVSKVYRAFSELDKFSESQCDAYVRNAWREHRVQGVVCVLMVVGGTIAAVFTAGFGAGLLTIAVFPRQYELADAYLISLLVLFVAFFAVQAGGLLLIRDFWLRRLVRKQLRGTRCPACSYSLLGLSILEGVLTCPECGGRHTLTSLGKTEADFAMKPASETVRTG